MINLAKGRGAATSQILKDKDLLTQTQTVRQELSEVAAARAVET